MKWMRFIFAWVAFVTALLATGNVLAQDSIENRPGRIYLTQQEDDEGATEIAVRLDGVSDVFGASFALALRPMANVSIEARAGEFLGDEVLFFQLHDRSNDEIVIGVSRKRPATGVNGSGVLAYVKMLSGLPSEDILEIRDVRIMDSNGRTFTVGAVPVPDEPILEPMVVIPDTSGVVGDTIRVPVEVMLIDARNSELTASTYGVSHLDFDPHIPGVSVIGAGSSDGDSGIHVSFPATVPPNGTLGEIIMVASEPGEYTLTWNMYFSHKYSPIGNIAGETVITIESAQQVLMSIPDTTGRVGEVLRIPVRVATGSDVPGVYSGAFRFEIHSAAMAVVDSGFTPAEGVLAFPFPKIADDPDGHITVSFVAMPPAQGTIGYLTVSMTDLGAWECEWGAILKTDLDPSVPPYEIGGKSIITGTAAFDVSVEGHPAVMGDAISLTMAGGTLPFFVPSSPMEPSMLLRAEERPDARVFALVPNDLSRWPAGKRAINMTVRAYDGNNWEVPVDFQLKARIGDANADHMVNSKDVVAILRLFLDDGAPSNNYVRVTADADGDGIISPNDAAYTLYMVIGVPVPVPLNAAAGKRLADIMITDDVIANALQFLRDLEGDESAEAEMARQMIYNLIGRDRLTAVGETEAVPSEFGLEQNFPNPFNPATTISYHVAEPGHARLAVYNSAGQRVEILKDGFHDAGSYMARWDAGSFGNGTYFYVLEVKGIVRGTGRMVLLK